MISTCVNCDGVAAHESGGPASEPFCSACVRCPSGPVACNCCRAEHVLGQPELVRDALDSYDYQRNVLRRLGFDLDGVEIYCGDELIKVAHPYEVWVWLEEYAAPKARAQAVAS